MSADDTRPKTALRFEPLPILRLLVEHGVNFVLIGGVAGNAHGSTSVTQDLDICYERTPDNIERLAGVLRDLKVRLRGAPPDLPFRIDARTIRNGLNFTFTTDICDFDCLGDASGYTYEVLEPNAIEGDLGGAKVLIASLDDLIRMKRAAGRLKDLVEIENLSKLRDVREERGLYGLAEPGAPPSAAPRPVVRTRSSRSPRRPRAGRVRPR